ncbi:DUF805 domain-containing protein [Staphylococcus pettenkoferi]|nr:DUF805 domain-containing protein [Staphylococcus pettenkoferi]
MTPSTTFGEAFYLYWKNAFNFKGQARRSEFWWMVLWKFIFIAPVFIISIFWLVTFFCALIVSLLTWSLDPLETTKYFLNIILYYSIFISVITFIPTASLTIRRCHDTGLRTIIPIILYSLYLLIYISSQGLIIILNISNVWKVNPYISIGSFIILCINIYFIVIISLDSKKGCNKYGDSPKYPSSQYEDEDKIRLI